jgi:hypothetical protein
MNRSCTFVMANGRPCRSAPLHDRPFCLLHDPEQADKAAEARRLGGSRRRHEGTLEVVYALGDLGSVEGIRRLLDIAVADGLALDPGIGRLRVLIAAVDKAIKLLETSDFAARLDALEALDRRRKPAPPHDGADGSLLGEKQP